MRKSRSLGGVTTITVTDEAGEPLLDYDGTSGAVRQWMVRDGGVLGTVAQVNPAAGQRTTFIPDLQGSIIASLDAGSGSLVKAGYVPYGQPSAAFPFGYTGLRTDAETGLTNNHARLYHPALGRFIQNDPAGYAGGQNLYAYVRNDPLNGTDRSGLVADGFLAGASNALFQAPISAALQNGSLAFNAGALIGEVAAPVAALAIGNGIFSRMGVSTEAAASVGSRAAPAVSAAAESATAATDVVTPYSTWNATGGLKGIETNVTAAEFSANLQSSGYTAINTVGQNGPVTILQNGQGSTYSIYTRTSTGASGVQYIGPSGQGSKYKLGIYP